MLIQDNREQSNERAVYTVDEIQAMLGIGLKKAYELVKSRKFPYVKVGKRFLIPQKPFLLWLNQEGVEDDYLKK